LDTRRADERQEYFNFNKSIDNSFISSNTAWSLAQSVLVCLILVKLSKTNEADGFKPKRY
jgi:hypothetical protein